MFTDILSELIFECNSETNIILIDKVSGLYDWLLPRLPEDLRFLDEKGDILSIST